ncbi:MAG: serine/threonine protein kinase, partial [Bdellovibrionales bacterium]|nr:serine/threonine protein kinase [Bdellovibrionales bacterium]
PNVLRSQRFFEDEQYCAFTMEFFESGTLGDLIEKRNLFTISEIINTLEQLLEGVQAIHAAGIIHRDLKPENILIDSNGICKIADFSIAVSGLESKRDRQTNLVGTMNFLSPEYIEKGEVDQRSDLYALGVIAYELITGKLPFQHGSLIDSLMSRVRFDPQHPIRLRADCPMALAEITLRALQRDPKRRYQNAEGMLKDLEKLKNAKQQQSQSGIAMRPSTFLALISHHDPLPT